MGEEREERRGEGRGEWRKRGRRGEGREEWKERGRRREGRGGEGEMLTNA